MTNDPQFNRLQSKLYLAYHEDGVIDLVIGLCATGFAIFMLTEAVALLILAWLPMLMYLPLKQGLTRPRFGYIRFDPVQVSLARGIASVLMGLLAMGLFFAFNIFTRNASQSFLDWMRQYHMAVLGGMGGIVLLGAALFTRLTRFYLYGLLAFLLPTIGAMIGVETYLPVLVFGLLVAGIGLWKGVLFVKNHPVQKEGEA